MKYKWAFFTIENQKPDDKEKSDEVITLLLTRIEIIENAGWEIFQFFPKDGQIEVMARRPRPYIHPSKDDIKVNVSEVEDCDNHPMNTIVVEPGSDFKVPGSFTGTISNYVCRSCYRSFLGFEES